MKDVNKPTNQPTNLFDGVNQRKAAGSATHISWFRQVVTWKQGGSRTTKVSVAEWFGDWSHWTEAATTQRQSHHQWILHLLHVPTHHNHISYHIISTIYSAPVT